MVRGVARGWKVAVVQFVKSGNWKVGEEKVGRQLGVDWYAVRRRVHVGLRRPRPRPGPRRATGWTQAAGADRGRRRTSSSILDELTYLCTWGWIDTADVVGDDPRPPGARQHHHHRPRRAGRARSRSPTRSPRCARSSTPTSRASAPCAASTTDAMTLPARRGAQRQERAGRRDRPAPRRAGDVRRHVAEPLDGDLRGRIARHRAERPGLADDRGAARPRRARSRRPATTLVIVDCLTLWVSNLMHRGDSDDDDRGAVAAAAPTAAGRARRRRSSSATRSASACTRRPSSAAATATCSAASTSTGRAAADAALLLVAGRALPLDRPVGRAR